MALAVRITTSSANRTVSAEGLPVHGSRVASPTPSRPLKSSDRGRASATGTAPSGGGESQECGGRPHVLAPSRAENRRSRPPALGLLEPRRASSPAHGPATPQPTRSGHYTLTLTDNARMHSHVGTPVAKTVVPSREDAHLSILKAYPSSARNIAAPSPERQPGRTAPHSRGRRKRFRCHLDPPSRTITSCG